MQLKIIAFFYKLKGRLDARAGTVHYDEKFRFTGRMADQMKQQLKAKACRLIKRLEKKTHSIHETCASINAERKNILENARANTPVPPSPAFKAKMDDLLGKRDASNRKRLEEITVTAARLYEEEEYLIVSCFAELSRHEACMNACIEAYISGANRNFDSPITYEYPAESFSTLTEREYRERHQKIFNARDVILNGGE